jgi:general secretion pathway protein B
MSYILDALRRADAERARGSVPDLHAQPLGLAPRPARGGSRRAAGIAAAVLLLAAAGTAAWITWQGVTEPPAPAIQAAAPPVAPAASDTSMPAVAQVVAANRGPDTPAAAQTSGASGVAAVVAPMPTAPPPPAAAAPLVDAAARATPALPAPAAPTTEPATARKPARAASLPAPAEARVWQVADLPADVRRELPPLRFGGAIHSPNPASRLLIVDGLLLHEGDEAAPGVRIRQIRLKSVVVEFRERFIELGF